MVSFGHSAFGLGMYGAAAALLTVKPPNLWLAIVYGLVGAGAVAVFVAYFSTRLREIYFGITTLVFSQIFYVIIFTWTDVTGGENGLTFSQPGLGLPGLGSVPFTPDRLHWFVLAVVTLSYLLLRRITQSPFGMVRSRSARTSRAPGHRLRRRTLQDRGGDAVGLFAGLAGVLYAIQNKFAARLRLLPGVRRGRDLQRHGGSARWWGRSRGRSSCWSARAVALLRVLPIPVGIIFVLMVIFLPQGFLGFLRRRLNQ
jgi:branched-chain amino acid transport system permease protein